MMEKTAAVRRYNFSSQDKLFLDTNIWMYLYGPPQKRRGSEIKIYSRAFRRILNASSQIYIDVLVVSEFINTYARMKWKLVAPHIKPFKTFRNSRHFKSLAQDIAADVKQIMKHCSQIESSFDTLEIDNLLNNYAKGNSDFNDQIITELCKNNRLTLITDDGDFKTQEIPVLTANQSLLRN